MEFLQLSDLSSALVGAANAYIHHQSHGIEKVALANTVSSIAGRWVATYMSNGLFDKFSWGFISNGSKNYLAVALTRFVIAKIMREGNCGVKVWETVLCDAFGAELLSLVGMGEKTLLGNFGGGYSATTGPVVP